MTEDAQSQTVSATDAQKLVATSALLLMDAMVFQEVAASLHPEIPTLSTIVTETNLKRHLEETWANITKNIDYDTIFDIALQILRSLPNTPLLQTHLRSLVNVASDIASSRVLLRHDLFGRIYHVLLLGKLAKYHATFYTSLAAARILARLAVNLSSNIDASSIPPTYDGKPLKAVDYACGSGTLLSALYKEIDAKHRIEAEKVNIPQLHRYLIEEGIWGFDVLYHAIHLAGTALSLHNIAPVKDSQLHVLPLGEDARHKYLGSIDFLSGPEVYSMARLHGEMPSQGVQRVGVTGSSLVTVKLPPENFHLCLMNPPFTRSVGGNLLFGSLPKAERDKLRERHSELLHEMGLTGIGQAGLGAVFVFIADKYLNSGGRVAFVLPRAVISGISWEAIRRLLLESYHIEYAITSYEGPKSWNFSENVDYSEILLVGRKLDKKERKGQTLFVNLWRKPTPTNEEEAIFLASQLLELYPSEFAKLYDVENSNASPYHLKLHGRKIGEAYSANLGNISIPNNNLGPYNFFAQMELNRVATLLSQGTIYLPDQGIVGRIPLVRLAQIPVEIGPDRRQVHDTYTVETYSDRHLYKAFWGHDSTQVRMIRQEPNKGLEPKVEDKARELWKKAGKLLIVERIRLNTYRAFSICLTDPVLSNTWWPAKCKDDDTAKVLNLWFNSTLGQLLAFSNAEVTEGPWISLKKEHLENLSVLNVKALDADQMRRFTTLYETVQGMELKPLPEELAEPQCKKVIDEGIAEILGKQLKLEALYKLLAVEPMITNNKLA